MHKINCWNASVFFFFFLDGDSEVKCSRLFIYHLNGIDHWLFSLWSDPQLDCTVHCTAINSSKSHANPSGHKIPHTKNNRQDIGGPPLSPFTGGWKWKLKLSNIVKQTLLLHHPPPLRLTFGLKSFWSSSCSQTFHFAFLSSRIFIPNVPPFSAFYSVPAELMLLL